jgi:DNA-binding HxlR family transcriptional regulator/putative sterol carrier protein
LSVANRSYAQFCPAARALDVVGERWTLLIVRDLLSGPKRYTDLRRGLPGIGPNVLAGRLKTLEEAGVVGRRELPPPAASTVYELTPLGLELRAVLDSIFRWGLNFLDAPQPGETLRFAWLLGAIRASFSPEAAREVRESYEFRIDDEVMHVVVDDGRLEAYEGAAPDPALVVTSDLSTFLEIARRSLDPEQALASGRISVEGSPQAARRCVAILMPSAGRLAETAA